LLNNRLIHNNRDALQSIYDMYRDSLLILAIALSHDKNIAEDAVQDVFANFAGNFENYNLNGNLKAYLNKCVANRVRYLLKTKKTNSQTIDDDFSAPTDENEPGEVIICNEELLLLISALAKLPYDQREVIVLHIYGKMRFRNIAGSIDVSVNTVKGRYRYGIQKLRSILNIKI
jgi:RNA polymerase sigma-70 factor, ECF subfamily